MVLLRLNLGIGVQSSTAKTGSDTALLSSISSYPESIDCMHRRTKEGRKYLSEKSHVLLLAK